MDKMIEVNYKGKDSKQFLEGTTLFEISYDYKKFYNYPILIAKVNNEIEELSHKIYKRSNIDFYDRSTIIGNTIYGRSLQFILVLAVKRVLGKEADVLIEHSMDKGFYCEIQGVDINLKMLKDVENGMKEIVSRNLLFHKISVSRSDAIAYFKKHKQIDKVKVLSYISNSYVNLYQLEDVYDYFYGDLAYSTGQIDSFILTYIKNNGFVVSYPTISNPECTLDYIHREKLFNKFLEYTNWGRQLKISNAADLNDLIANGKYKEVIQISEYYSNIQLMDIAKEIYDNRKTIKLVLLAGPTSSGKTTTAKKLELFLQASGVKTHQISVDNYFLPREKTPKTEDGEYDFESIRAIDINLFNRHLNKLINNEKVLLPEFNFITGKREYHKNWLQIGDDDVIILEGLHALNNELTLVVDRKNKYKIYVSPLTQLNIDKHNRIHTSDIRRLRRIVRDNQYRGYSASDTLHRWKEVTKGEEKNVFSLQDDVDVVVNSALIYEIGVLKTFVEPLLFSVNENDEVYPEAIGLINLLRNFLPIPTEDIPKDSVLREFIGHSFFKQ